MSEKSIEERLHEDAETWLEAAPDWAEMDAWKGMAEAAQETAAVEAEAESEIRLLRQQMADCTAGRILQDQNIAAQDDEIKRLREELTNLRTTTNIQAMQSASVPVLTERLASEAARRESAEALLNRLWGDRPDVDPDIDAAIKAHFARYQPKKDP